MPKQISDLPTYESRIDSVCEIVRDRLEYFKQIQEMYEAGDLEYFFTTPAYDTALLICSEKMRKGKDITPASLAIILSTCKSELEKIEKSETIEKDAWNKDSVKEILWPIAESEGRGIVLWSIRVALSGKEKSPDPFTLAEVLGKEETLIRIQKAISLLNN